MAHMLNSTNDMAYVGKTPWHGLGNRLQPGASIDEWRVAANLNWSVEKRPVLYTMTEDPQTLTDIHEFSERNVLIRLDNQTPLSVVGHGYNPVQPAEVLEFYRDLTEEQGFQLETAGCLAGGKRIWALAKTGNSARIKGQDKIDGYLLFGTSFDLKMATIIKNTSVRVVCQNTLSFALDESGTDTVSIPHSTKFDANIAKTKLGLREDVWAQFEENINKLAEHKVTASELMEFFTQVLGEDATFKKDKAGNVMGVPKPTVKKICSIAQGGMGQKLTAADGTLWGLVNGVTEFYDHHATERVSGSRLNNAWFGRAANTKRKAFEVALQLCDIAA